ncbi:MAG: ParD-like family protein [Pseudomonadota bacterium]
MGIVKISDHMHENLRVVGNALSRSINAQAEHWMRIGMLAELHPGLQHSDICQLLIRAEQAGGFDLATVSALPNGKPRAKAAATELHA